MYIYNDYIKLHLILSEDSLSSVLQQVLVTVFPPSKCEASYSTLRDYKKTFPEGMTTENMVCVGHREGGKDACEVGFDWVFFEP